MGDFRGRAAIAVTVTGAPLGRWPGPWPDREAAAPSGRRDIRPSLGTEKGLCASPGPLPCPDHHTEAPCSWAGQSLWRPDALCPPQRARSRLRPYQTHCRARHSLPPDWLIFNPKVLSYSLIGLSFPSLASDWPGLEALSSYHHRMGSFWKAGTRFFPRRMKTV